jgi:hypothetical protein
MENDFEAYASEFVECMKALTMIGLLHSYIIDHSGHVPGIVIRYGSVYNLMQSNALNSPRKVYRINSRFPLPHPDVLVQTATAIALGK